MKKTTDKALTIAMICEHAIDCLQGKYTVTQRFNWIMQNVPAGPVRTDFIRREFELWERFPEFIGNGEREQ
jgi:hypothetical protein